MNIKNPETSIFSWIHLSDIHLLHGDEHHQTNQEMIIQELISDVNRNLNNPNPAIPQPDAIFVTGDIAFSGAVRNEDEYLKATKWLNEIADVAHLSSEEIFVIPGNHDVQRNIYLENDDHAMLLDLLREKKRTLGWALSTAKYRKILRERFNNYLDFASDFAPYCFDDFPLQNLDVFWQYNIKSSVEGTIRLLGLNTALLSQNDQDKKNLRLSLVQIKDFPDILHNSNQINIVLGHHPLNWLSDGETIEKWLRKKGDVYLSGHIHKADSTYSQYGGGGELIHIQAGSVHGDNDPYALPNSYNYGAIVRDKWGETNIHIWHKIWSNLNMDFRTNTELHSVDKPYAIHPLSRLEKKNHNRSKDSISSIKNIVTTNVFKREKIFVSDSPPVVDVWVGRETEVETLNRITAGVIVISGIGGQGKSTLAAKYLEAWEIKNPNIFWDWRDCREQRERFHSQIVGMIEHWTKGEISGKSLESAETKDIVGLLFELIQDQKGLIILDNLDHYVDLSENKFILGVEELIQGVLNYKHNLTIVITCRPRINYADPRFHEIHLEGISNEDTLDLFQLRKVQLDPVYLTSAVKKLNHLTDGHPLWLNIIATQISQIAKGQQKHRFEQIISDLESGHVDNRTKTLMRGIWKRLNIQQQTILRQMAELIEPEEVEWIHKCIRNRDDLKSWYKFQKSFASLKNLSLVVESYGKRNKREYDLHPIVRTFVLSEYSTKRERKPYLNGVIWAIDKFISEFGGKITILTPINRIEHYTKKAELALRKEDLLTALKTLTEVGYFLIQKGIPGEFFRLSEEILDIYDSGTYPRNLLDEKSFHQINNLLGTSYAEYGRRDEARNQIKRYSRMVPNGTVHYISVCEMASYIEWVLSDYEQAIYWGEEGVRIKTQSNVDTNYDAEHNLALAQRDNGNVEAALKYFSNDYSLEDILNTDPEETEFSGPRLGNIGRCLYLQEKLNLALKYFIRSANLLESDSGQVSIFNRGFAALWIGQVLEQSNKFDQAYISYRRAQSIWLKRSPIKASEPTDKAESILKFVSDRSLENLTEAGIERAYKKLIY